MLPDALQYPPPPPPAWQVPLAARRFVPEHPEPPLKRLTISDATAATGCPLELPFHKLLDGGDRPLICPALIVPPEENVSVEPFPTTIAAEVFVPPVIPLKDTDPTVPPVVPQVKAFVLVL